eukprot:m.98551 g.98551  ORF g.98551 m.98551 type:complete len:128 (+) comp18571_c0_seq3:110-493(+)
MPGCPHDKTGTFFFFKVYPPKQFFVIQTEELFTQAEESIERVQKFLGIPKFDYTQLIKRNSKGMVSMEGLVSKADGVHYESMLPETKAALGLYYMRTVLELASLLGPDKLEKYWKIDPAVFALPLTL